MERNNQVIAIYRIAEKKIKDDGSVFGIKTKPDWINNINCLKNFKENFDGELIVFGDRLNESLDTVKQLSDQFFEIQNHGNSESFREVLDWITNSDYDDSTIVYMVEDDYWHKPNISRYLQEGLGLFDFVTLYDHPDKHDILSTTISTTQSSHWIRPLSTTMTFATHLWTLKQSKKTIEKYLSQSQPSDYYMWQELLDIYTLGSPIPTRSTHGEVEWLAPFYDIQ